MNNYLLRIISLFLVPCLVADPLCAFSYVQVSHGVVRQTPFEDQALIVPLVVGYTREKPPDIWVRKTGGQLKAQQILAALNPLEGVISKQMLFENTGIDRHTIAKYLPDVVLIENARRGIQGRHPLFLSVEEGISYFLSIEIIPSIDQAVEWLRRGKDTLDNHHFNKRKVSEEKRRRAATGISSLEKEIRNSRLSRKTLKPPASLPRIWPLRGNLDLIHRALSGDDSVHAARFIREAFKEFRPRKATHAVRLALNLGIPPALKRWNQSEIARMEGVRHSAVNASNIVAAAWIIRRAAELEVAENALQPAPALIPKSAAPIKNRAAPPLEITLVPHSSAANILGAIQALATAGIKVSMSALSRKTHYSESFIKDQIKAHPILLRAYRKARKDQASEKLVPLAEQVVAPAPARTTSVVKKLTPKALYRMLGDPNVAFTPYHRAILSKFLQEGLYPNQVINRVFNAGLMQYESLLVKIFAYAGDLRGKTVLEIGCGPGVVVEALHRAGVERITGLERDPAFVQMARAQTPSVPLVQGDLRSLPASFKGRKFDVVFSNRFLDDATPQDLLALAALSPVNGLSVHLFWKTGALKDEDFERAGFKVVESEFETAEFNPLRKRGILILRKAPIGAGLKTLIEPSISSAVIPSLSLKLVQKLIVLIVAVFPLFGFTSIPGTISGREAFEHLAHFVLYALPLVALGMADIPRGSDSGESYPYPVWGLYDFIAKRSWTPGLEEAVDVEAEVSLDSQFGVVPSPSKNAAEFISFLVDHPEVLAPGIDVLCVLADPRDPRMSLLMDKYSAEHDSTSYSDTAFSDFLFGIYNQKRTVFVPMNLIPRMINEVSEPLPEHSQLFVVRGLLKKITKRLLTTRLEKNAESKRNPPKEGGMWPFMIPLYTWLAEHVHTGVGYYLAPVLLETAITLGTNYFALLWLTSARPTAALLMSPANLAAIQCFWVLLHIIPQFSFLRVFLYLERSQNRGLWLRLLKVPPWILLFYIAGATWASQYYSLYVSTPVSPSLVFNLVLPIVFFHLQSGLIASWLFDFYEAIDSETLFALQVNGKVVISPPPNYVEFRRMLLIFGEFTRTLEELDALEKETNDLKDPKYNLLIFSYTERKDRLLERLAGLVQALREWVDNPNNPKQPRHFYWYMLSRTGKTYLIDKFVDKPRKRGFSASLDALLPAIIEIFYGIPRAPYQTWRHRQQKIHWAPREDVSPEAPHSLGAAA